MIKLLTVTVQCFIDKEMDFVLESPVDSLLGSADFCPNDFCPKDFCRLTNAQKTFAQQTFAQNTRKWKLAGQLAPPSHVLHVAVCFSRFYLYGNENFGKFTRFPFMIGNFHQASLVFQF